MIHAYYLLARTLDAATVAGLRLLAAVDRARRGGRR